MTMKTWAWIGGITAIGAIAVQLVAERFSGLPIGPARMGVLAIVAFATGPISVAFIERWRGRDFASGRRLALCLCVPLLFVGDVLVTARFLNGPFGPIPGGPLRGDRVAESHPDWGVVDAERYVALEVGGSRSIETLAIRHGADLYVGANYPQTKLWPHELLEEPDVTVRVDGRLYDRLAERVEAAALQAKLLESMNAKYGFDVSMGTGVVWFYRLAPRGDALALATER